MTDKEMAEDYIKGNCERWERDCLCVDDIAKENFLAGLKAGRPEWHKVADGDLPKRDERFVTNISIAVMTQDSDFAFYSFDDKKWYSQGVEVTVVVWTEIPKYVDEESK